MNNDWENDFEIDPIGRKEKKKKKADGGKKGKRVERNLAHILTDRFKKEFSRSLGSGNRWSQIKNMPVHAKETLTGDLCCPVGFKFVIESKGGYSKIDLNGVFEIGNSELDSFMKQAEDDSIRIGKMPLLIWKKDRKPWMAFVKTKDLQGEYNFKLIYKDWTAIPLIKLLELEDSYFFN